MNVSIPKAIFYTGLLTLAVLAINMSVFLLLGWDSEVFLLFGWYPGEGGLVNLCSAIMIEGAFMAFSGFIAFIRITDTKIYGPASGRLYPPRPTATIAFTLSGVSLFLIGLFTFPAI